jgi:hypothetical protein
MGDLVADLLDFLGNLATGVFSRGGYIKGKSGSMIATLPPLPKPPVMAKAAPVGKRI